MDGGDENGKDCTDLTINNGHGHGGNLLDARLGIEQNG
jgi:hypothetical protein